MSMGAAHADLTVTVTEEATVFSGLANVERLDRPSPSEIAHFVGRVVGPEAEGECVSIVASAPEFRAIEQALRAAGCGAQVIHGGDPAAGGRHALRVERRVGEDITITRPSAAGTRRGSGRAGGGAGLRSGLSAGARTVGLSVAAVALAVAAAGALSAWAIWRTTASGSVGFTAVETALASPTSSLTPPTSPPSLPSPSSPPPVVISRQGLTVELPAGFHVAVDEDMWRATGADPNFRLQIAVDPLYGLPADQLVAQVEREIDEDPALEPVSRDGARVTYRERAADGSQAIWHTWVEGDYQVSLGCHTRYEPTKVQQATCAMAANSATFDADEAGQRSRV